MKTVMIFEIEQELYNQVTAVLNPLEYTLESAIVLFMEACVACNGIPFTYTQEELDEAKRNPIVNLINKYQEE